MGCEIERYEKEVGELADNLAPDLKTEPPGKAAEIGAQLAGYSVAVVLEDGEPSLLVREDSTTRSTVPEDLSARITLRLPDSLKDELEAAAGETGDSVNAFVVKALSTRASRRASRRITETFET